MFCIYVSREFLSISTIKKDWKASGILICNLFNTEPLDSIKTPVELCIINFKTISIHSLHIKQIFCEYKCTWMDCHSLIVHTCFNAVTFFNVRGLEVIMTFEVKSATKCLQMTIETARLLLWVPFQLWKWNNVCNHFKSISRFQ